MKIFYDTEFIEDGKTIDLISIGMVAEDGRELYAVNRDMPVKRIAKHNWLMKNVVPSLPRIHGDRRLQVSRRRNPLALDWHHPDMKPRAQIAEEVRSFVLGDHADELPYVELWANYSAYDHVALCQLWGRMIDLPEGMPMFTRDIQQEAARLDLGDKYLPRQAAGLHNALADARHNRLLHEFLIVERRRSELGERR